MAQSAGCLLIPPPSPSMLVLVLMSVSVSVPPSVSVSESVSVPPRSAYSGSDVTPYCSRWALSKGACKYYWRIWSLKGCGNARRTLALTLTVAAPFSYVSHHTQALRSRVQTTTAASCFYMGAGRGRFCVDSRPGLGMPKQDRRYSVAVPLVGSSSPLTADTADGGFKPASLDHTRQCPAPTHNNVKQSITFSREPQHAVPN